MAELEQNYTETERVILERRSVRKYKKDQLPEWMVKRILETGRYAPSAGNGQAWKYVVLRDPKVIRELSDDMADLSAKMNRMIDYRQPGRGWLWPITKLLIRFNINYMNPTPFGALKFLAEKKIDLYYDVPTVILIFKDVRGIANPDLDAGIAGQNMVLAAHSMGLGTCWISFTGQLFKHRKYGRKWNDFFGIDYPYEFISSLAIGWPFAKPDGMVTRPVHPVDWFEAGQKKTISAGGSSEEISRAERKVVPRFDDRTQTIFGTVSFDHDKCTQCGICIEICPASSLLKKDDRLAMVDEESNECIYCGACQAICPVDAITMERQHIYSGMFKTLGQGTPCPPRLDPDWSDSE